MQEITEELIRDIVENSTIIKKHAGRPKGATKEKFSLVQRLKLLKEIALDKDSEQRVKLAAIDLYTKLSGDAVKVSESGPDGTVIGIEFDRKQNNNKSITAPPENKMIETVPIIKVEPVPKVTTTTTTLPNSLNIVMDIDVNPHWNGGLKPEDL